MDLDAIAAFVDQRINLRLTLDAALFFQAEELPPQPCNTLFTTTGLGKDLSAAYSSAKAGARDLCQTNKECTAPEFQRYVSSDRVVIDNQAFHRLVVEWKCTPPS